MFLVNRLSLTFGPNNLVSFNSKMVLTLKISEGKDFDKGASLFGPSAVS